MWENRDYQSLSKGMVKDAYTALLNSNQAL